jgi:hypothetical protein
MKKIIIIIVVLMLSLDTKANDSTTTHFEVSASMLYWHALSAHMIGNNNSIMYEYAAFYGFGNTIAPSVNINYYLNNGVGLTFGYNYLHLEKTDADKTNTAILHNLRLGFGARIFDKSLVSISFFAGVDIVAHYHFEMPLSFPNSEGLNFTANGSATGAFFSTEANFHIYKNFFIHTSLEYTYIPIELKYSTVYTNIPISQTEKTNIGGVGILLGVGYQF